MDEEIKTTESMVTDETEIRDTLNDTSEQAFRQWRNPAGILINAACFSCKWSTTFDFQNTQKQCNLPRNRFIKTDVNPRCHFCEAWSAAPQYVAVGSGRNYKGGVAAPGKVKSFAYLQWWVQNHGILGEDVMAGREDFKQRFHMSIYD